MVEIIKGKHLGINKEQPKSLSIPVTEMTRRTAKAMLPPSYHPSSRPYKRKSSINLESDTRISIVA